MDNLKELVEIVKDLPDLAILLIALYFFYKIFIVGSIYMTIRFVTQKIKETLTKDIKVTFEDKVNSLTYTEEAAGMLLRSIATATRKINGDGVYSNLLHTSDVNKICKAIENEDYKSEE